jgi:ribonuclease HII
MSLLGFKYKDLIEAGCDEAGRGCLAGPVVAAAVILPHNFKCKELDDSKKISEKLRNDLRKKIEDKAIDFAIGIVEAEEIDNINILNASFLAMHRALDQLKTPFNHILVDGNRFKKYHEITHDCIIKGDGKFKSIAAASILAKTERDKIMEDLHLEYPQYNWAQNKAYPSIQHRQAIKQFGVTPHHRKSFKLYPQPIQLKLF